jgi:2'-5' RNA ligase
VNLRLFVALVPPEPVRRRLAAVQAALRRATGPGEAIRWVEPDHIHLTLQFLGAVPEERLPAVREAVAAAAAGARPLRLEVAGAGAFPGPRRPRVVWSGVGGEVEALAALVASLGRRLEGLGYPPEDRPFHPHLTHGRVRQGQPAPGLGGALAVAAAGAPFPWRVDELVLFRSHLSPSGALHEALARLPLSAG